MKIIYILALFSLTSYSKELKETVHVKAIKRISKNEHKVLFMEKAAHYTTSKKHLSCLRKSIQLNKEVQVNIDINKLSITNCTIQMK